MEIPSFSLTAKGVQMKLNGGFVRQKIKTTITNLTILWAAIFTIIISVYTLVNYIGNNGTENKINDDKPLNSKTELTTPKVTIDTTLTKSTDTTNNISKHNK